MEIQQLLNSALVKTNEYINLTESKEVDLKNAIETKNNLISTQSELIEKLRNEMNDFLKVSFASKWMNEAERLKKKNEELSATNKSLNQTLDNMTNSKHPKTYEKDTQTDKIRTFNAPHRVHVLIVLNQDI